MLRYVRRDLLRNPRRTLASLVGVTLGVGLFSGVLFFIDGSGASMTKRAIAPLALDMQRVLTSPLGGGLRFTERILANAPLAAGQRARVVLRVTNLGSVPVHEVVVNDAPPPPLAYVPGSTRRDGAPVRVPGVVNPLAQGLAASGLNLGTLRAGATVRLSYLARATRAIPAAGALRARGTVSSREDFVPAPANSPSQLTLDELRVRVARIPGVASADGLAFVDLPPGSLRAGGRTIDDPVRVFGFDRRYQRHYPDIRVTSGDFGARSALISAEASRALRAARSGQVTLAIPGRRRALRLPVGGVVDLARARPLFYSRSVRKLEEFLYIPYSVVVSPGTFRRTIVPAYRSLRAARGVALKNLPILELDILVGRQRLQADPATAFRQTKAIAGAVNRIAPRQDYLIDSISNALQVARDDARVGRRMFFFLGLPGLLLAAFLAGYAGSILASAHRREQANLRVRGAHRGHLLRILTYKTLAFASVGSLAGTALGFVSAIAILGSDAFFEASGGDLARSAVLGTAAGLLTTALALYIPGRRALGREVGQERREMALSAPSAWRRWRLDFVLVAAAAIAEILAFRSGAFDAPSGSVSSGEAVSLPSHLLVAPVVAWFGGMLLAARVLVAVVSRLPVPAAPRFGPVVRGTLGRTLRRRSWALATGIVGVGLVVAFGVSLAVFAATYDAGKAADAKFVVGSDIRVTPSVLSTQPHPPSYASRLRVPGIATATPVVFKLENSITIGPYDNTTTDLAAIDPARFRQVAPLADSFFPAGTAAGAMRALERDPHGVLIDSSTAEDLHVEIGDAVRVLLARATRQQTLRRFRVVGIFDRFPAFPQGVSLVANLSTYDAATRTRRADFFLARATDPSHAGLARATAALRAGPGRRDRLVVDTAETSLDKDQSSLTAVNVHGLVDLDWLYTLLMSAAGIAIFVFGLMLQRRREYVTLRAQGMQARELQTLVSGEAVLVAGSGLVGGVLVGAGMGFLVVHILRPLFIRDPSVTFPVGDVGLLVALVLAATVASTLAAMALLRRLSPTEVLREE